MALNISAPAYVPISQGPPLRAKKSGLRFGEKDSAPSIPPFPGVFERTVRVRINPCSEKYKLWWVDLGVGYSCYDCYLNYTCSRHRYGAIYHYSEYKFVHIPELPPDLQRKIIELAIQHPSEHMTRWNLRDMRLINHRWRDAVASTDYFQKQLIPLKFNLFIEPRIFALRTVAYLGEYYGVCAAIRRLVPGFIFRDKVSRSRRPRPWGRPVMQHIDTHMISKSIKDLKRALERCINNAVWTTSTVGEQTITLYEGESRHLNMRIALEESRVTYSEEDLNGSYEASDEEYYSD